MLCSLSVQNPIVVNTCSSITAKVYSEAQYVEICRTQHLLPPNIKSGCGHHYDLILFLENDDTKFACLSFLFRCSKEDQKAVCCGLADVRKMSTLVWTTLPLHAQRVVTSLDEGG